MSLRLIVIATHPVQYQAPYFRALATSPGIELKALYAWLPNATEQGEGFAEAFEWDVPLLDGYSWALLDGVERKADSPHGFAALSAPEIAVQLKAAAPDALLITGWHSRVLVQAALAARKLRVPALVRGEANDLRKRRLWLRLGHRWLLRNFAAFLAIGKANRRFYASAGVASRRIFEAPYAVDNERFVNGADRLRPQRSALRRAWEIPVSDFCLLFAGKLQPKKRPFELLEALEQARRTRSDLRLLIAGSGELETAMRERARERRLPVTFAGFMNQTEMPRAYAAADALVLPSDAGETWGLVVNEAMASGLPAVVSDRVGCREDLVEEGITGFSFALGDTRSLAACFANLAADPIRAAAMGEAAQQLLLSRYSIGRAVAGTLEAIEMVAGKRTSA